MNVFKVLEIESNLSKLDTNCPKWIKIGLKLFELDENCPNWINLLTWKYM